MGGTYTSGAWAVVGGEVRVYFAPGNPSLRLTMRPGPGGELRGAVEAAAREAEPYVHVANVTARRGCAAR